jgi:glycine/D-amino acid oxidase-like deaminating enzyme
MQVTSDTSDVIVIGGGLVGVSASLLLAEAGLRVTVFEAEHVGAAASGRNAGSIQHPLDPVRAPLYEESVDLYRRFGVLDGCPGGLLGVARTPEGPDALAAAAGQFPSLKPELLGPDQVRALDPELAPDLLGCLIQTAYPTTPHAATARIAALAHELGVRIIEGQPAEPLVRAGRVTGVRTRDQTVPADTVVLAAGPWTPGLIDPSQSWRPVDFDWGVTVHIEFTGRIRHRIEELPVSDGPDAPADGISERWEVTPTRDMTVLGATHTHKQPDERAGACDVLSRTARFVPAAARAQVAGVLACARPTSFDGRPLIGRCGADGLYAVTGHGPYGISLGPGSARMGMDALLHGSPVPAELSWERFAPPPLAL